jgi:hypothetical protein
MVVSGQLHAPAALPIAIAHSVGGPQSRDGRYGKEKSLLLLPGIDPRLLGSAARSPVAIPTELFLLLTEI